MIVLAFDIYGTLINPAGITQHLQSVSADKATAFAGLWRQKQLEYTFRRGLMDTYRDFSVCIRQALQFTAASLHIELGEEEMDQLMALYLQLPAFADTESCLKNLDRSQFLVYAFSNGTLPDVQRLLEYNNLLGYFREVISVDAIGTFKPSPAVYRYFLEKCDAPASSGWLISSNPFDVIGAVSAGMKSAWIQRDDTAVFDPWEFEPTVTLKGLEPLQETILKSC